MKNCLNKCVITAALVAGLIGFVAGNAFWYLASPLWIDNVVQESLPSELSTTSLSTGSFKDADWQKATKDAQIEESIRKGKKGTLMAGFAKQLSDDEITALVDYVRKLGPEK